MADDDLEDLKQQSQRGDRLDEASDQQDHHELTQAIVEELEAIDAGEKQKTVSVWDGTSAAFVRALEEHPEHLETVGHALQSELGLDEGDVDRSDVVRLALRLGFREAAPDTFESARDAVQEQATKGL